MGTLSQRMHTSDDHITHFILEFCQLYIKKAGKTSREEGCVAEKL